MTGHVHYVGGHHVVGNHIAGGTDHACDIHTSGCKYCDIAYPAHSDIGVTVWRSDINGCGAIVDVITGNVTR